MKKEKWVWIIAGGILQIPIIKEAQRRGYKVIVSDMNGSARGARLADQVICISTYDINGHLAAANAMKNRPVAVLAAGADIGPTVSAVADALDLPAASTKAAITARNKYQMREATKHFNPFPRYLFARFDDSVLARWRSKVGSENMFPCVVKPLDNCGSRGITLVEKAIQFPRAMTNAYRNRKEKVQHVIIEEYLDGDVEVALDFFVEEGKLWYANGVLRDFSQELFGKETGHLNPWVPSAHVKRICKEVQVALDVQYGPLKIDLKQTHKYGWVVMETATRLSGGFDHMYAAPLATGKDITGAMLDISLGLGLDRKKLRNKKKKYVYTATERLWEQSYIYPESEMYVGDTPEEAKRKAMRGQK